MKRLILTIVVIVTAAGVMRFEAQSDLWSGENLWLALVGLVAVALVLLSWPGIDGKLRK